jgi:predicted permease
MMSESKRIRFRFPWRSKKSIDRALDAELELHFELRTSELMKHGMTQAAARAEAIREFGDIEATRRYCREEDLRMERSNRLRDRVDETMAAVTYAIRSFHRSPGFTVVSLLTLALAVGANTTIFSVANAVLLAPLPFGEPDRLVSLYEHKVAQNFPRADMSAADLVDYQAMQRTLTGIGILSVNSVVIRDGDSDPMAVQAMRLSVNGFDVLRARPMMGRTFAPDEGAPAKRRVVVLSAPMWLRLYGREVNPVGRTLMINDESHVVIGVMPHGFGMGAREEVWVPLDMSPILRDVNRARKMHWLYAFGRLKPGISIDAARADLGGIARRLESQYPEANTDHLITVMPMQTALAGGARNASLILAGAAALVLLIACANLGNMMLARAVARRREMTVRAAIGANRGHLVRQLLTESIVLAVAGGIVGIAIAAAGTPLLVKWSSNVLPPLANVQLDWRVLAFSLGASILTGVLIGLVPAIIASRLDVNAALKESARGTTGDRRGETLRQVLVVTQVAMAMVLMMVAGLLVRSFEALRNTDLGFQPARAVAMSVAVRGPRYQTKDALNQFYDAVFARLRATPGIAAVGGVSNVPLLGSSGCGLAIEDQPFPPDRRPEVRCLGVRGDYFRAIGTPLLEGRMFDETDLPDGPQVTMINAAMAKQYWPNESPIGKRIRLGPDPALPWMTIVGVVGDQRQSSIESDPLPTALENDTQHGWGAVAIVVRTTADAASAVPAMRAAVREVDPTLAVRNVRTLEEIVGMSLASRRFSLSLISGFAVLALVLAVVGIYGVLSYTVAARTRELGIRMALGATARSVRGLVLGRGLAWTAVGALAGVVIAMALARVLRTMLYRVAPSDPATFVAVTAVFIVVAICASLIPAVRATRVDPLAAIREE